MQRNEAQEEAVHTVNGPVIIISCPGSGKTTTLIRRIRYMIDHGVPARSILMVTFTRAAAKEMEQRYIQNYGEKSGVTFRTIHSLCLLILRECMNYRQENILSEEEQRKFFLKLVREDKSINDPNEFVTSFMTEMSSIRNNRISIVMCETVSCDKKMFLQLVGKYAVYKRENYKIDYDDILIFALSLLEQDLQLREKYQNRYQYVMCDEYQDTNYAQRDILYLLAGKYKNFCVVGDDDQSIYGFRGAHPEIMLNFKQDFPSGKEIHMSTNYRSRPEIIHMAKELIGYNQARFQKDILPSRGGNGKVEIIRTKDRREECGQVAEQIQRLHGEGIDYKDMAVLFRTNKQMKMFVDEFMKSQIPFYSVENLQDIYSHWIFRDIRSYHMVAEGRGTEADRIQIMNRPYRGLTEHMIRKVPFSRADMLAEINSQDEEGKYPRLKSNITKLFYDLQCMKGKTPGEFMRILQQKVDYPSYLKSYAAYRKQDDEELLDIFQNFVQDAQRFQSFEAWGQWIREYQKQLEEKKNSKNQDGVVLSTMHRAKGLEWDCVFIADCYEDSIPYKRSMGSLEELEEERRLFYVAVTRAKERLYLYTCAKAGNENELKVSRFIPEMTGEKRRRLEQIREREEKKRRESERISKFRGCGSLETFLIIGQPVEHKIFGEGVIEDYDDEKVTIWFESKGTKVFLRKYLEQMRIVREI